MSGDWLSTALLILDLAMGLLLGIGLWALLVYYVEPPLTAVLRKILKIAE